MFDLPNDEILSLSKEHVFYTWSAQAKVNPIALQRAKGVYFWDADDRRYLDFNSMTMCVNIGHGDERVIKAMQDQAAELPYAAPGMTTKIRALARQDPAVVKDCGGGRTKIIAPNIQFPFYRGYDAHQALLEQLRKETGLPVSTMSEAVVDGRVVPPISSARDCTAMGFGLLGCTPRSESVGDPFDEITRS